MVTSDLSNWMDTDINSHEALLGPQPELCPCFLWARGYAAFVLTEHHRRCEHYSAAKEIELLESRIEEVERLRNSLLDDLKECAEKIAEHVIEREVLTEEFTKLNEAQFVPGVWQCAECNFQVSKNILYVESGAVGADRTEDVEGCPNDGMLMQRVTWKQYCTRTEAAFITQVEAKVAAQERVAELEARPCPHVITGTEGTSFCRLAEESGKDSARLDHLANEIFIAPRSIHASWHQRYDRRLLGVALRAAIDDSIKKKQEKINDQN